MFYQGWEVEHDLSPFSAHLEECHGWFWVSWSFIKFHFMFNLIELVTRILSCIFDELDAFAHMKLKNRNEEQDWGHLPRLLIGLFERRESARNRCAMDSSDGGCVSLSAGDGAQNNDSQFDDTGTTNSPYNSIPFGWTSPFLKFVLSPGTPSLTWC